MNKINSFFMKLLKTVVMAGLYVTTWALKDYGTLKQNTTIDLLDVIVAKKLKQKDWGYFSKASQTAMIRAFIIMNKDNAYYCFWDEVFREYYEVRTNQRNIKEHTVNK